EVLRAISPLASNAAFQLIANRERAGAERLRQRELALEQARYEVTHARRQYDAVDPDNRLVAGELERRWNERLAGLHGSRSRSKACRTNSQARCATTSVRRCWHSLMTCLSYGTIPPRPTKPASGFYGPSSRRSWSRSRPIGCASCCTGRAGITRGLKWSRTVLGKIAGRPTWRPCNWSVNW